jgi:hypothetical protein
MRIPARLLLIGSLLCAGIVRADDELDHAITDLNGTARLPYAKWSMYAVIALQTDVVIEKLMADRKTTGLGYGELLVAESLAGATGKPVSVVVAQKQQSESWAQVAKQNGINPGSLTGRLHAAMDSMHIAERTYNQQRQMNMNLRVNGNMEQRATPLRESARSMPSTTMRQPMAPISVGPNTGSRRHQ